jgi:predicted amidohydrolase
MGSNWKIAAVQMDVALADKSRNLESMIATLATASKAGARLVAFPECAITGYCFESLAEAATVAEPIPGPSTQAIADACRRFNAFAVFGTLEKEGDRVYNACVLAGPAGVVGVYHKIHLPFLGVDMFVTRGSTPFRVWRADDLHVGMNICYDCSFPESSRIMALDQADLIVLPTNWPTGAGCTADFLPNTRALENHVYYVVANRVGTERGFQFIGKSRIVAPTGQTLALADHENPAVLYADIDPAVARNKHLVRVPGKHEIDRFADRRPELYGRIIDPIV